jgi:ubiquinone/menaquinone biosynthesis C-methylase UbiE
MTIAVTQEDFGQAAFTKSALAFYDSFVLRMTCRWVWRCPNERVLAWYGKHLSANHLEVGVGTGYFLDHAAFPAERPRIALLDLNPNCLERTVERIARYSPETYQANLLEPIRIAMRPFDSVALNYVLHCLPGAFPEKGMVFAHLKEVLNPGAVVFGSTVLNGGVPRNFLAKVFIRFFNARKTLSNERDEYEHFITALHRHLRDVQVEIVGSVALFSGRV